MANFYKNRCLKRYDYNQNINQIILDREIRNDLRIQFFLEGHEGGGLHVAYV